MKLSHRTLDLLVLVLFCGVAAMALLPRLGESCLWEDEAQTALISKTILTRGFPYGTDGKNFFSAEAGAEYGKNYIWKWHTWLSFYVVAAFFNLFGVSTLMARLPFALFGILTIGMQYILAADLWNSRRAAVLSAFLLLTNVPFLILSRQARYYSMTMFFTSTFLYAYIAMSRKRRWANLLYVLSAICLFHSQHVSLFSVVGVVLVHGWMFHRDYFLRQIGLLCLSGVFIVPWLLWMSDFGYFKRYSITNPFQSVVLLGKFIGEVSPFILPLLFLAAAGLLFVVSMKLWNYRPSFRGMRAEGLALVGLFWLLTCILLGFIAPGPYFRYLAPVIPLACAAAGLLIDELFGVNKWLGSLLLGLWCVLQPLRSYAYELAHAYKGPMDGYVMYLQEHGRDEETVAITYEDMPLKFYTKMRVLGGLTGEDLEPARHADWVILRRHSVGAGDAAVLSWLTKNVSRKNYRAIELPYPDTMFQNRETPARHQFRTAVGESNIILFEKIKSNERKDTRL